jgi:hypothetical protein
MRPHIRRRSVLTVRPLEPRLAPATLVNATTVTYQDLDHDLVTVRFSKPLLTTLNAPSVFSFDSPFGTSTPQQLSVLNLGNFTLGQPVGGISVTASAVRTAAGGDNLVNVGYILAGGIDLGSVKVKGDLGGIDAGDGNSATPGLMSLTVQSLGRYGLSTGGVGSLVSGIEGKLGTLVVKSDIVGAFIQVFGSDTTHNVDGQIGKITIGGSLLGAADNDSGAIEASGDIGPVGIKGDITGGAGLRSGLIESGGKLAGVSIGGSLIGGSNGVSGAIITSGNIGAVKIGHDAQGGSGANSGLINSGGKLASVSIGGSLIGGAQVFSGKIFSQFDIGEVTITGDVRGGAGQSSGSIQCLKSNIASVTIGGSLIGGGDATYSESGTIISAMDLGQVTIAGDIRGGSGQNSGEVLGGRLAGVSIGGSLLGGSNDDSGEIFSQGDMGAVKIGHDAQGGSGFASGIIECGGKLAGVSIGGSLIGGGDATHDHTGIILGQSDIGQVTIVGDIRGGAGQFSGEVQSATGKIASVTIGGSLIGSSQTLTGDIFSIGDMGAVTIAGDIRGGAGQFSGEVQSAGKIASVTIGGSLVGGTDPTYPNSGNILAEGDVGQVTIAGDIRGGAGEDSGEVATVSGNIAGVTVGGSLIGGGNVFSGKIFSGGSLGLVKIAGDVRGGNEKDAGSVFSTGSLAGVTVGGSLVGNNGSFSADIHSDANLGPVTIAGDVRGGVGNDSGEIFASGTLTRVTIGGSLIGGSMQDRSGLIDSRGAMGPVFIGGDVIGGSSAITLDRSGFIEGQRIASVIIGGSVIAGTNLDTSGQYHLTHNGSIHADQDLGPVTVLGSVLGNPTFTIIVNGMAVTTEGTPVIISAVGHASLSPGAANDVAIASLKVGGRVEFAEILAGYDIVLNPVNGDAQIGAVTVGTDWIASTMVAGVMTATYFGSGSDTVIPASSATRSSKIASITVGGQVLGTPDSVDPFDHYAFESESIGSLKIGGTSIQLKAGRHNDDLYVGTTGDLRLLESL